MSQTTRQITPQDAEMAQRHADLVIEIHGVKRGIGKTMLGIIIEHVIRLMGWNVFRWETNIPMATQHLHCAVSREFRLEETRHLEPRSCFIRVVN